MLGFASGSFISATLDGIYLLRISSHSPYLLSVVKTSTNASHRTTYLQIVQISMGLSHGSRWHIDLYTYMLKFGCFSPRDDQLDEILSD